MYTMKGIQSFEDLYVWQESRKLAHLLRSPCARQPGRCDFEWRDQIMGAALSVMSNIAEGFDAQSDVDFANFCNYAKRSAAEVRSQIYYGFDSSYMTQDEFKQGLLITKKIGVGLSRLIHFLKESNRKRRAHTTCSADSAM